MKNNRIYVFLIALVAALGGFLFGFDTAVISGTTESLTELYDLSSGGLGFTVASALIGTILGAMLFGRPADRYGRRLMLKATALLYLVSALGSAYAWSWEAFIVFRLIGGIGVGGASVVSPMYIAEISPPKNRGKMVALQQFNIVFGILMAFVSNYIITRMQLGDAEWRWMFGVEALPAFLFLVLLFTIPFSPRWLVGKGRRDEASAILKRIEGDAEAAEKELREIEDSFHLERRQAKEPLFQRKYVKVMLLAVAITAFNQLSGINAVLYYAPMVFKLTGSGTEDAMLQSVLTGLVNLIFTMVALAVIDKMGRKKLMLFGSVGYILSLGLISGAFFQYAPEFKAASAAIHCAGTADKFEKNGDREDVAKAFEKAVAGLKGVTESEDYKGGPVEVSTSDTPAVLRRKSGVVLAWASDTSRTGGKIVLWSLFLFIASHAFGQGAVVWVFVSEIFPNRVRARGQSLGAFSIWVFAALVSQAFVPVLNFLGGGGVFALFCGCMVIQLIWVLFVMPETKGIPLEEIEKELGIE